jgi:hypothetical protein
MVGPDCYARRPKTGQLIAVRRKPYRVLQVGDLERTLWSADDEQRWLDYRMPDPWPSGPYQVRVSELDGQQREGVFRVHVGTAYDAWQSLPEHYAVCVRCGDLAPCREVTAESEAARMMERFERLSQILPGCCWSCREPVTGRQESIDFPGENVWLPTAPPGPVFHLRRQCRHTAARYEREWVKAWPGRARSLLTLTCTGNLVVHGAGDLECFGAESSDCPSPWAAHGSYTACYVQSHGCPRECPRVGHPGASVRGKPPHPRAVTRLVSLDGER